MRTLEGMVITGHRHGEWVNHTSPFLNIPRREELVPISYRNFTSPIAEMATVTYDVYMHARVPLCYPSGERGEMGFWVPSNWAPVQVERILLESSELALDVHRTANDFVPLSVAMAYAYTIISQYPLFPMMVPFPVQEETYSDDMPGMTLEEFQKWSDEILREAQDS